MRYPKLYTETAYHLYNRSLTREYIFKNPTDYYFFINNIYRFQTKYEVEIISYCIMPNHFHLLVKTSFNAANISNFMKSLQLSYAHYFNKKYNRAGRLFQGVYKNKPINDIKYLQNVIEYISENPVRKKLVKNAQNWPYTR